MGVMPSGVVRCFEPGVNSNLVSDVSVVTYLTVDNK